MYCRSNLPATPNVLGGLGHVFDTRISLGARPITFLGEGVALRLQLHVAKTYTSMYRLTLEVHITSLRCMFIHVSQLTKCPLYVSPFFSSTNLQTSRHLYTQTLGLDTITHHWVVLCRFQQRQWKLWSSITLK